MPIAELLEDKGLERDYRIDDGRVITLKYEEDDPIYISFWDDDGEQLGRNYDFNFVEDDFRLDRFLLARMYVPIKKMGLGRAALQFFIDMTGATVYTRSNDGYVRDDGSHLTGDAPAFVFRMQQEGLIENDINHNDNEACDDY